MNMGEAISHDATLSYFRDDLAPPFSVIAFELKRDPVEARSHMQAHVPSGASSKSAGEASTIGERFLRALRLAAVERLQLGFSELCQRSGVTRSGRARGVLLVMVAREVVKQSGRGHGTRFWVELDE